jgi:AraC-like DNA-binding protein
MDVICQIKELQKQYETAQRELIEKIQFRENHNETGAIFYDRQYDQRCQNLCSLILKDKIYLTPSLTRKDLARRLGVNIKRLSALFISCFGTSFNECINSFRLNDAIVLLQKTDHSILEISEKTGFGTIRSFQRRFQHKYGMTPNEFRHACSTMHQKPQLQVSQQFNKSFHDKTNE